LREKWYNEPFETVKIDVKGVTELEKIVNATYSRKDSPVNIKLNNTLGEDQYLVQEPSHNISEDVYTFPDSCPINLGCSDPPMGNEKAILDIYRNTLNREPDKMGFYYWIDRMKKGDTIDSITQAFKNSPEYRQVLAGYDKTVLDEINDLYSRNNSPQTEGTSKTTCKTSFGGFLTSDIEDRFICSSETPICWGYSIEKGLGNCGESKGYIGSKAIVLGNYNMSPWNMNNEWFDTKAKWIWYTKNADIEAGITGNVSFYYTYFNHENEMKTNIYISVEDRANVYLNNAYILTQTGGFPSPGIHRNFSLKKGENYFRIDVLNKGINPKPAGLLFSVTRSQDDNQNLPLFQTDESWTYQPTFPIKPNTYIEQKNNTSPTEFNPLIALWNKKHGGFLKMSLDTSIQPLDELGELSLLKSSDKKLPNTYAMESAIFKWSVIRHQNETPIYSLYNCRNQRYARNNKYNIVDTSHIVIDQHLPDEDVTERWIPVINDDNTVSLKIASELSNYTRFLSIHNDNLIVTKTISEPDDDSKWEIVNIDTIYIGNANSLENNKDNKPGFIKKITDYIGHVGKFPINPQKHKDNKPVMNESFMSYNIETQGGVKNVSILRSDFVDTDSGWEQDLTLFGIHDKYMRNIEPTNFELISTGTAKRMIITNNKIICFITNGKPYLRELNAVNNTSSDAWTSFSNGNQITDLTCGKVNDDKYIFGIIDGTIKFRLLSKIYDSSSWETYNSNIGGFTQIKYDIFSNVLYGLKDDMIYLIISRSEQLKLNINIEQSKLNISESIKTFALLNNNVGTNLLLVDKAGKLFVTSVVDGNSGEIVLLADNINISRLDSINNIIFAIHEDTGQLYYKPVLKNIPFRIYNNKLPGNLIDVHIYKDEIYVIDSKNQVLKCPIILN
jgi:hypothetical protein